MPQVIIPNPGGDKIGRRRIDTHLHGLAMLGVRYECDHIKNIVTIQKQQMKSGYITLQEPSITGTANILMAACGVRGKTIIYNAACEPYIQQLCTMLNQMGAKITGIGSNLLTVYGVGELKGTTVYTLSDIIEIASFIGLAAITGSEITITDVDMTSLGIIISTFEQLGIQIIHKEGSLYIPKNDDYEIKNFIDGSTLTISDGPWPMFSPDLLSIILVTAIQARGTVLVHQKMYESRLFFVDKLIDMGARIILCDPHRAVVIGLERKYKLRSITASSPDIRAGIALLIAALSAQGTSRLYNIEQIDRGYQNIDIRLNQLGAKIARITE